MTSHRVQVVLTKKLNYDEDATIDNNSCEIPAFGYDCDGTVKTIQTVMVFVTSLKLEVVQTLRVPTLTQVLLTTTVHV